MGVGPDSRIEEPSLLRARTHLIVVAVVGFLASVAIFLIMLHLEKLRGEAQFLEIAAQRVSVVKVNVGAALDTVATLASHFAATRDDGASRRAFSTLVAPVLANHRYLKALEWIPRVERDARSKYELARADGVPTFNFKEVRLDGVLTVAGQRDEYFPVLYVVPLSGNERAVGYDLASNPVRAAMVQACDSGRLAATARVRLVQEKGDQWGTLVFAPVYKRAGADGVESRRESLVGFGLSVLRIGDLIAEGDSGRRQPDLPALVDLHLFDMSATASERQLYPTDPLSTPEDLMRGLHSEEGFEVGGRRWLLVATPSAGFTNRRAVMESFLVLFLGLVLTAMYLRYLKARLAQSAQIAQAAHEIRCAQAELRQTNEMLEAVIQCSPLGVVTLDLAGRVTMWNPAAEHVHGWSKEEVLGQFLPVVLPENDKDEVLRVHNRILTKGAVMGLEYVALTKDSARVNLSVSGAPLHNANGEQNGAVYLVMDITQRKRLEVQLEQAQRLESVGQLAAGIAHEINTPIQYVGDNLRFLGDAFRDREAVFRCYERLLDAASAGEIPSQLVEQVRAVRDQADMEYLASEIPKALEQAVEGAGRVANIVRAMKTFAHPGDEHKAPADLNKALSDALIVATNELKYVADVVTDFGELPLVLCNLGDLNQVFLNLLVNAAHAVGEVVKSSGAKGKITVRTRCENHEALVSISDTGCGIAPEIRSRVFDPFFTTKEIGKGTGQGLAIARNIVVERHGGRITFEPNIPQGATFLIFLPVDGAQDTTERSAQPELEGVFS